MCNNVCLTNVGIPHADAIQYWTLMICVIVLRLYSSNLEIFEPSRDTPAIRPDSPKTKATTG